MSEDKLTAAAANEMAARALPGASEMQISAAVASVFVDAIQGGKPVDRGDALNVMRMAWRERLLSHGDMMLAALFVVFSEKE